MDGIRLKNIEKTYLVDDRKVEVLKGIDLMIPAGKITVVLGKSGCGKTTLLRIASGLEKADKGEVLYRVDGESGTKIGFVFQESRLMPWLNVWENVRFGCARYGWEEKSGQMQQHMIRQQIERVGLHDFEKAYPHQLSGGMQQRVAIARAFAYNPAFIMMDEPFAALDYFTREQMQKELLRLQKESKVGILFVTHSIDEALLLGDKIVIVENGQIKSEIIIELETRNLLASELILQKKKILEQLNS